jgi:predicted house-cleaning noncanonical NTP pyrophosphatase (MazG superfamily)
VLAALVFEGDVREEVRRLVPALVRDPDTAAGQSRASASSGCRRFCISVRSCSICRQSPAGVGAASWNGNVLPFRRDQPGGTVQVMRVTYRKLVRDQIPAIIAADGHQAVTRVLDHAGYEAALRTKLLEEAHEAQAAPDGKLASELADVLEALQALAAAHGMGWEEVVSEASRKRAERGGFDPPG